MLEYTCPLCRGSNCSFEKDEWLCSSEELMRAAPMSS